MSIFKQVKFNDGEGIEPFDFDNISSFLRSQLWDTIGAIARVSQNGATNGTSVATAEPVDAVFAVAQGGAPIAADTAYYGFLSTRKVGNFRGVVMQRVDATPNGDEPAMLAYYVEEDEWSATLGANGTAFPRCDIGVIKLDTVNDGSESRDFEDASTRAKSSATYDKKRHVRCQFQVVIGSPAAGAPEPAVPVGWAKVWSATVGPGMTTMDNASLRDHRYPIGVFTVDVPSAAIVPYTARVGTWATGDLPNINYSATLSALAGGFGTVEIEALQATGKARLLKVELTSRRATTTQWTATLRRGYGTGIDTGDRLGVYGQHDASAALLPPNPAAAVTTTRSLSLVGSDVPIWGNGSTCGPSGDLDTPPGHTSLRLNALNGSAVGDEFGLIRFTFCGSL